LGVALLCPPAPARAAGLTVAAAASLRFVLDAMLDGWREAHPGDRTDIVYGSSGKLVAQIGNGAPFDVFVSADTEYPAALLARGLAVGAVQVVAVGRLVSWSLDPALGRLPLSALVADPRVHRLAIANPGLAPYGSRARQALQAQGLWVAAQPKLVFGENVAQAAQFVDSGAADAAIVALSLVRAPALQGRGAWTLVPAEQHRPLEHGLVVTAHGRANPLAAAFVAHLLAPANRALWQRFGFEPPG
jgi:molybdate transport system substrate-binding protein